MSKRHLKKYLSALTKEQISEQFVDLYDKFPEVKTYYDFIFNPKEEKLIGDARQKIYNEYFPVRGKRPKMRRSVAQKLIKHFILLGVEAFQVTDLMLYNVETAMKFSSKREMKYASFYKSVFKSFEQAITFSIANGSWTDFKTRFIAIGHEAERQHWENAYEFAHAIEDLS